MDSEKIKELAKKANLKISNQDIELYSQTFSNLEIYLQNIYNTKFPKSAKKMKRVLKNKLSLRQIVKFKSKYYSPLLPKKVIKNNSESFSNRLIKIKG